MEKKEEKGRRVGESSFSRKGRRGERTRGREGRRREKTLGRWRQVGEKVVEQEVEARNGGEARK